MYLGAVLCALSEERMNEIVDIQPAANIKDPVKVQADIEKKQTKLLETAHENPLVSTLETVIVLDEDGKVIFEQGNISQNVLGFKLLEFLRGKMGRFGKASTGTIIGVGAANALRAAFLHAVDEGCTVTRDDMYAIDADPLRQRQRIGGVINPLSLVFPSSKSMGYSEDAALARLRVRQTATADSELGPWETLDAHARAHAACEVGALIGL